MIAIQFMIASPFIIALLPTHTILANTDRNMAQILPNPNQPPTIFAVPGSSLTPFQMPVILCHRYIKLTILTIFSPFGTGILMFTNIIN